MNACERLHDMRGFAGIEAAQRVCADRLCDRFDRVEMRLRRTLEMDEIRAAVGRIRAPFDEPHRHQLIDDASERNRLHLERLGKVDLTYAIASRQVHERTRLCERQRRPSLTLAERATHQARDVRDKKAEVSRLCGQRPAIRALNPVLVVLLSISGATVNAAHNRRRARQAMAVVVRPN